ncbi:MAG TPA: type II secretion system F family protein [Kofleriaceae bacterium]|nr:type II secretion system F family protein [Kofleriaceae bacterium]
MDPAELRELVDRAMAASHGWIAYVAILFIAAGGAATLVLAALTSDSALRRRLGRYEAALDRELKFLLHRVTGIHVIRVQAALLTGLLIVSFLLADPFILLLSPFIATVPLVVLRRRRDRRVLAIELQLDSWLIILSNALKAAPSLGEALATSATLTREPVSQELDLVLKEVRLGSPIDEALLHMGARVNSRMLWGGIATLLVARQTGGDVSRILEESAATLREMARLEGVVKAKTADARAQAYVLAAMPFALLAAVHLIDPNWLDALGSSTLGNLIIAGAGTLWVLGYLSARKILAVDL